MAGYFERFRSCFPIPFSRQGTQATLLEKRARGSFGAKIMKNNKVAKKWMLNSVCFIFLLKSCYCSFISLNLLTFAAEMKHLP